MAKGRKNGCPTNVRDWLIYIQDKSVTNTTSWVRIYGLDSLTWTRSSETQDGSSMTDIWSEPYVTKRSGSLSLEGKPIVNASTGAPDAGQEMLDAYAEQVGCDGDATIKFVDPFGHTIVADFIVTSGSRGSTESENTVSWDMELVGEPETQPYVAVSSVAIKDGSDTITTLSMAMGATPKVLTVAFTPSDASNTRFRVNVSNRRVVGISNITETTFTVTPMSVGTANVTITTMNGNRTATVAVTITAAS